MMKQHRELLAMGEKSFAFWGRGRAAEGPDEYRFANDFDNYADALLVRLFGRAGFYSTRPTERLLEKLSVLQPDVVHLHNLHGYYLNVEMLFDWLLSNDCRVVWTLHDCWAFTGHCAYFTYAGCNQWKSGCGYAGYCPQLGTYPRTISSAAPIWSYEHKRRVFTQLSTGKLTLVTPSQWLADLVGESYLRSYPVVVRHNTIDKEVFVPTSSDFRERYGVGDRLMILGVASPWSERKGLHDLLRLSEELDPSVYAIVLVGLASREIKGLPKGVIGIPRTSSPQELAAIYTAANLFFNPTREDNYPTVNLEAEACGTDVITYNVGGCAETIHLPGSIAVTGYAEAKSEILRRGELRGQQ